MSSVRYESNEGVATITLDDGKVNALSFELLADVQGALDQALADECAVILTGREGRFSGGFDLPTLTAGGDSTRNLLRAGFELSYRLLSFPFPVVIACTGHAYAMGSFLLLSGDYRFGVADGGHRITANEVAIGMTMPRGAIEVCRQRLRKSAFDRAVICAEVFSHESAIKAGFLDAVVPADELAAAALAKATEMRGLNMRAHAETKARCREDMLVRLRTAIEADDQELAGL